MAAPEGTTMDTVTIFYVSRHAVLKKVIVLLKFMLNISYLILLSHKSFTVMDHCQPYDLGQDPPRSTRRRKFIHRVGPTR